MRCKYYISSFYKDDNPMIDTHVSARSRLATWRSQPWTFFRSLRFSFSRGMILDRTKIHYKGRTIIWGYLIFGPSLEWRRSRETAALRLAGWLYPAGSPLYHGQIPLSPSYFIDGHRSRMKIEDKRGKGNESER